MDSAANLLPAEWDRYIHLSSLSACGEKEVKETIKGNCYVVVQTTVTYSVQINVPLTGWSDELVSSDDIQLFLVFITNHMLLEQN